jgi:hypothetical protein
MKHTRKILLGILMVVGLQFAGSGCVGYAGGGGVYYGGDVWVHDDAWIDGGGRGWYGGHAYVHPGWH